MKLVGLLRQWRLGVLAGLSVVLGGVLLAVTTASHAGPAQVPAGWPVLKLRALKATIVVTSFHGDTRINPDIWLVAQRAPLEINVYRAGHSQQLTVQQELREPGGRIATRLLPGSVLDGWSGLTGFLQVTVRDSGGKIVDSRQGLFCPNSAIVTRFSPSGPLASPYPTACGSLNPFPEGTVWGIANGWGVNPLGLFGDEFRLPPGKYLLTETIAPYYTHAFNISPADASATVRVTVLPGRSAGGPVPPPPPAVDHLLTAPVAPVLGDPPKEALPHLVALPAWQVSLERGRGTDLLTFAATVWDAGRGPLDIQGQRDAKQTTMTAYQYISKNGRIIGRAPVGTLDWEGGREGRWEYGPFATYTLLDSRLRAVTDSHKLGFCVVPNDPVDLTLPGAVWRAAGDQSIACGSASPGALTIREVVPAGWGDTYFPEDSCPSFDITSLPNGSYYIQITPNPRHLLYGTSASTDSSLRLIILGGTPGHRTVSVPAWHGIDPET